MYKRQPLPLSSLLASSVVWRSQLLSAASLCHLTMKHSAASTNPRYHCPPFLADVGHSTVSTPNTDWIKHHVKTTKAVVALPACIKYSAVVLMFMLNSIPVQLPKGGNGLGGWSRDAFTAVSCRGCKGHRQRQVVEKLTPHVPREGGES